jgi:hypothetical protein
MTNASTPPEVPPEFDRRGVNRAASQWVRNALTDQSEKIDKIGEDVNKINDILTKAIPNANWDHHHADHMTISAWGEERGRIQADADRRMEENRQFWLGVKQDVIKWVLRATLVFAVGIFVLGFQTKFKEWVVNAIDDNPTVIESKK